MIFPGVVSKKQCCNTGSNGLLPEPFAGTKNTTPRNTHHKNLGVTHIFLGVISPNSRNLIGVTPRNTKLPPNFTLSRIYPRRKKMFPRFFLNHISWSQQHLKNLLNGCPDIYIYIYIYVRSSIKSGENATNLKFFLIESLYLPHDRKNTHKKSDDFFWYPKSRKTDLPDIYTGSVMKYSWKMETRLYLCSMPRVWPETFRIASK